MKSKYITIAVQLFFIFGLGVAAIWVTSFFNEKPTSEEVIKEIVKEIVLKKPSCPDTFDEFNILRKSGQIVTLARDLNSYGENGHFVNPKITVVKSSGSGSQVACGYLYVKAHGENNRALQTKWEHPYVKPGQFGGHLGTETSIIPFQNERASEFLFNLAKISYKTANVDLIIKKADWAALLNVSDRIEFEIALNTIDKAGVLEEVSIAYQCWSPETGQITHDCRLSVE